MIHEREKDGNSKFSIQYKSLSTPLVLLHLLLFSCGHAFPLLQHVVASVAVVGTIWDGGIWCANEILMQVRSRCDCYESSMSSASNSTKVQPRMPARQAPVTLVSSHSNRVFLHTLTSMCVICSSACAHAYVSERRKI